MEKYWLRKADLSVIQGPWTIEELRQALNKDQVSIRWETRKAMDGTKAEVLPGAGWDPVWQLLGMPDPGPEPVKHEPSAALAELREQTHYLLARRLAKMVVIPSFLLVILLLLAGLFGLWMREYWDALSIILGAGFYAMSVMLFYLMVTLLIDIADCLVARRKQQ